MHIVIYLHREQYIQVSLLAYTKETEIYVVSNVT